VEWVGPAPFGAKMTGLNNFAMAPAVANVVGEGFVAVLPTC
jgi:hypothetical protein